MTWRKEYGMRSSGTVPQTRRRESISSLLLTFTCMKEVLDNDFLRQSFHVAWIFCTG